ncbi:hypothetical protein [Devosia sp. XK-2]|uniref:hypothetical protein n=1 Tax=Devosia sp. XK-2 TaxID=3126689 RepID=UPI0030D483EC
MRLSLEISPPGAEPDSNGDTDSTLVEIYLDAAGRDELVRELLAMNWVDGAQSNEHFHLYSEKWGGYGLTEERRVPGNLICRGLKVYLRPDDEPLWSPDQT